MCVYASVCVCTCICILVYVYVHSIYIDTRHIWVSWILYGERETLPKAAQEKHAEAATPRQASAEKAGPSSLKAPGFM